MSGCGGGEGGGGAGLQPSTTAKQQQQQHSAAAAAQLPPQQVLRSVNEEDSASISMEELFAVLNPDHTAQKPQPAMITRDLPRSFFQPPTVPRGGHSREGSQDSTSSGFTGIVHTGHPGLPPAHSRSQSEPIALHNTLSSPPPPQHAKQISAVDYTTDLAALQQQQQWGEITKQQPPPRFLSQPNGQNWQPDLQNKSLSTTSLNQQQQQQQNTSPPQLVPRSTQSQPIALQNPSSLPLGWEQGVTPDGEIYYINHVDKTTSWFDPRIPKNLQRPAQKMTQRMSPTTAVQLQQQQQQQQQQLSPGQQATATTVRRPVANEQFVRMELLRLQEEKRRLKREQEDVLIKEQMLKEIMTGRNTPSSTAPQTDLSQQAGSPMQAVSSTGVDPFLGQPQTTATATESHARQNSSDSGLGGMGTYSLSRTPEDFLTNLEEMDSQDTGSSRLGPSQKLGSSGFGGDLSGGVSMEVGGDPPDSSTTMDSDDLVPSLHVQEDLGSDLLHELEVDVPKIDNFTWL